MLTKIISDECVFNFGCIYKKQNKNKALDLDVLQCELKLIYPADL